MPKLPEPALPVSYSWIFAAFSPVTSQTLIFPSFVVAARKLPSSLKASAQAWPGFVAGPSPLGCHSPVSGLTVHTLISPPKPAVAATRPSLEVQA